MKIISKAFFVLLFILFLVQFSTFNLYPWFKHYGDTSYDGAVSIQQTSDVGYIVAGSTESYTFGGSDFAIYKLDSAGNQVWFKHYGGPNYEYGQSIQQTSDGGYIVAGQTDSFTNGGDDMAIYRLDSSGNKVWFKHYGGTQYDYGRSIQQTSDGGYIVAGLSNSFTHGNYDFAIYKLDSSGSKVWFRHYGGSSDDRAHSIRQTSDGGYIVAGYTVSYSHGSIDFAIYRLDSSGNKVWFRHYGGLYGDNAHSIQQTSDGGYIVAGQTDSFTYGSGDFGIYKLNSSGNKVWFRHYGGTNTELANSIQQTSDGGYIVAGHTKSYTYGDQDYCLYKLNSSGNKAWFKHYGGTNTDNARSMEQTSDGGYIIAGATKSYTYGDFDSGIYKLDSNGNK